MGRCDRENADGVASVEVPANEEAGEKDGRVGVQGREVEKERMLAGRRTGDCAGFDENWVPVGSTSSR